MPLYEYGCLRCGERWEHFRSIERRHWSNAWECPHCGSRLQGRVITAPHLHGSPNMPND